MSDLEEFHKQLIADIQGDADALGLISVEAFFEKVELSPVRAPQLILRNDALADELGIDPDEQPRWG